MRKIFTLLMLIIGLGTFSKAAVVVITVSSNQFSPSNPTVQIGDIVRFNFIGGFHNVTQVGVTDAAPAGAAPVESGAPASGARTYDYTVTVAGLYKFYCEVHADPGSFTGMVGMFTASIPVPVELKDFRVIVTAQNKPLLSWETLTEQNVSHFSIQKSTNGFNYTEVGNVTAVGNSVTLQAYSFTDNTITAKEKYVYYILKIIDRDGKFKITPVKMFKNPNAIARLVTSIGPNPISRPGQLMVQFNSEKNGSIAVKVFNASGKLVTKMSMTAFTGLNNGHIHVCDFNPGTYIIQFEMDGIKEMKRVVVH